MRCEDRRGDLVGYLYGELEGSERRALEEHLAACATCEGELAELAAATSAVRAWREREEPWSAAAGAASPATHRGGFGARLERWWRGVVVLPRWGMAGLATAAVALVLVSVNLNVERSGRGLTLSWGSSGSSQAPATAVPAGLPGTGPSDSGTLSQVAAMLVQSEERQRTNTAELVQAIGMEYARRADDARREDLAQVDAWMGAIAGRTQQEFARTNDRIEQMAELLVVARPAGLEPGYRGMPYVRQGRLEPGATGTVLPTPDSAASQTGGTK